ncbi:MAG: helix-turn-helix domain-containing protein [Dermatophilus congolensis]|nr:helix-turn-helix domain-containing protein [Dermatophilus congolensis]
MTAEATNRSRARTRLPADQRRTQLLAQAARLFMERGYAGVGIDEIGAAVGISGPAVYRHVSGKEQLVTQIAAGWLALLAARTRGAKAACASSDTEAQFEAMLAAGLDVASSHIAEVTVVLRYTEVARHSIAPPPPGTPPDGGTDADADNGTDDVDAQACLDLWHDVSQSWAPVVGELYPQLSIEATADRIRLVTGLLLGAASSEREIPQTTRVALLAQATRRILETEFTLPAPAPTDGGACTSTRWTRSSRREQILDTAVAMFRERGYGGVSMADIAEAVGVTPSASYRHFTSKEELLATAVDRAGERLVLGLSTSLADASDAQDAIDALIRTYVWDALVNRDSTAVCVTERYHLPDAELALARKRDRLMAEEWGHALAVTRPELSLAGREMLVHAVHRMVVEAVRPLPRGGSVDVAPELMRLCHAILDA